MPSEVEDAKFIREGLSIIDPNKKQFANFLLDSKETGYSSNGIDRAIQAVVEEGIQDTASSLAAGEESRSGLGPKLAMGLQVVVLQGIFSASL